MTLFCYSSILQWSYAIVVIVNIPGPYEAAFEVLYPVRPSAHVSVCLYVHPVRTIYSKLESCRNFKFGGHMTLNTSNWENKFKIWCPKIKVTENDNLKIVFCAYLRQAQIDLHQTKTKMIFGRFYTYRRVHLINENALYFVIFVCLSVCLCAYHSPHIAYLSFTQYWNAVESTCMQIARVWRLCHVVDGALLEQSVFHICI